VAESEVARIVDQLQREHDGDPWHGSPVMAILDGVDAARATQAPIAGGHSIWQLVLHVTGWKREVARRVGGAPAGEPAAGDWPAIGDPTETRWRAAVEDLGAAHRELIAAVETLTEARLFEPTNDPRNPPLGTGVSYYILLHGAVQHDVYHAGQIALLKKAD
jgi:uncharacterized damage-inducible protein DinB